MNEFITRITLSPEYRLLRKTDLLWVLSFLQRAFKERNLIVVPEEALEARLALELEDYARSHPDQATKKNAAEYLAGWTSEDGYLRKTRDAEADRLVYQLTAATQRVLRFLTQSQERRDAAFVSAESGFSYILGSVNELAMRTTESPEERKRQLLTQQQGIAEEIREIEATGRLRPLTPAQIRERLTGTLDRMRDFLSEFSAIQEHFIAEADRLRQVMIRENESKGDALERHLSAEQLLRETEQGRSYYAFQDIAMSREGRRLLDAIGDQLAKLADAHALDAAEFRAFGDNIAREQKRIRFTHTRLSRALRDLVESGRARDVRRLRENIEGIKREALRLRYTAPEGVFLTPVGSVEWDDFATFGFHSGRRPGVFRQLTLPDEDEAEEEAPLPIPPPPDWERCRTRIAEGLRETGVVSLAEILARHPAESPVELAVYLSIAGESADTRTDKLRPHRYLLPAPPSGGVALCVTLPHITFFQPATPER